WPNDTFLTVNEARAPPRCSPMTMPSNTWMRSLSPSRTFTCTFTVSPDFMSGSCCVICVLSTSSIEPMGDSFFAVHQLLQNILLFDVQLGINQPLRPPVERQLECLPLAPFPDFAVVSGHEHVR